MALAVDAGSHAVGRHRFKNTRCHVGDKTPQRPPKPKQPKLPKKPVS